MDEGILFEAEGDFELLVVGAGEVDPNGGSWDGFLGLWQTELNHEPECAGGYLT